MTGTLSLARVFALGAWVAAVAVLSLSLDVHGWVVACDPARDDNPPDCREAKGSREDRLRMLEELLDEHFRHRAAFDVWELDFEVLRKQMDPALMGFGSLFDDDNPKSLRNQLSASWEAFDKRIQAHGYDVQGRVRPNGEDFDPTVWSEDVIVRRVDPSNSDRLLSYSYSPDEQVEYLLGRFRALRKGDPGAAIEYWFDAEVTVAVNIAADRQADSNTESVDCAAPDACVRMDKLLRDWKAIWNEVLTGFYVETRRLQTEVEKFATRVEGDRASAMARLAQLTDLKKRYPYEDFSEEEAWLHSVIEGLSSVKRGMASFEEELKARLDLAKDVEDKFRPRGQQAAMALDGLDVQRDKHRVNSRNLVRISTFLEERYGPERLLAGIDQLRYTDVHYYPRPKRLATHMTLQTRGRYLGARYEHARLFFDPQDISKMSLCFTRNDACVFPPRPDPDQHMSYVGEVQEPLYYHMRPFTRNRSYLLYGAGPGPGSDDDVGFARVRVWDDEWSDLSLDEDMTHSYLTMGSWMRAPEEGGFTPQFGAFVSIDDLGLGRNGRLQSVFALPVKAWPRDDSDKYVFFGEAEGVYAAGRTPEDTAAGVFTGGVLLIYDPPRGDVDGRLDGAIGGAPRGYEGRGWVIPPLDFRPYYGTNTVSIRAGSRESVEADMSGLVLSDLSAKATRENPGSFTVTGVGELHEWDSGDPGVIYLVSPPNGNVAPGRALTGGVASVVPNGEFQLVGTSDVVTAGPLFRTKLEVGDDGRARIVNIEDEPLLVTLPVKISGRSLHGPDGRWEAGFFNVDHPATITRRAVRRGAFTAGVFHLGYNWILQGGTKGALTGAFVATPHESLAAPSGSNN